MLFALSHDNGFGGHRAYRLPVDCRARYLLAVLVLFGREASDKVEVFEVLFIELVITLEPLFAVPDLDEVPELGVLGEHPVPVLVFLELEPIVEHGTLMHAGLDKVLDDLYLAAEVWLGHKRMAVIHL